MLDWIKTGKRGKWTIEHFDVSQDQAALESYRNRRIFPGRYTRLYHEKRGVVMSDGTSEMLDLHSLENALVYSDFTNGACHVNGLGLGIAAKMILDATKSSESIVYIVEIDPDVITLVGCQLHKMYGNRIIFLNCDALEYKPPAKSRFDIVWHDIWDELDPDNLSQARMLKRRWRKHAVWQGVWAERTLIRMQYD